MLPYQLRFYMILVLQASCPYLEFPLNLFPIFGGRMRKFIQHSFV
jgi:hypothetical protein